MSAVRVTILIDSLIGGGAEAVAVEAAAALDRERFEPHLLVTRHGGTLEARVREASLPTTILGRHRGFHPRTFEQAAALVAEGQLLHAHKFAGSVWGSLLSLRARRPLIAHEHTFDGTADRARATLYRYLVGQRASRIVCVSEGVRDAVRADGVAASKLVVVPNGVRLDGLLDRAAARAELDLPAEGAVVGMVARLRTEKQHELAFAALALLRDAGMPATLAVVGDGPREAELRSLADELALDVRFAGERRDARTLMRAFDAVLLTSAFEGMPLAVLEALVAGVPVAATDVGTLRDLFAHGGGEVAPAQTPEAVATTLRRVLEGEVPAAPPEVVHAYSIDRLARDLERIYDEVLGR